MFQMLPQKNVAKNVTNVTISKCYKCSIYRWGFVFTVLSLMGNSGRLTRIRLQQPQEQCYPVLQAHAWSFRVSVIQRTLTWTTGALMCVRDHFCVCVYTRGLGTPTVSQHNMFDSEYSFSFSWAPDGIRTRVMHGIGTLVRRSTHWATNQDTIYRRTMKRAIAAKELHRRATVQKTTSCTQGKSHGAIAHKSSSMSVAGKMSGSICCGSLDR